MILGADLYPPGHSIVLGSWFRVFGTTMAAWITFGLVVFFGTSYLLARAGVVAALAFVVSPMLAGLAPTLMVEPVAGLFLVSTFTLFPQRESRPIPSWRFVAFGCAATATLLTKYNVGLPLLPAALVAAMLSRDRRILIGTALAIAVAAALWAGFLSWQDDGWANFLRFAENRSNSAGWSPWDRLAWYGSTFASHFVGSTVLASIVGALALVGGGWILVRERPWSSPVDSTRLALALAYAVASLLALVRHEYLLSRNLLAPAIAVFFAAGLVVARLPTPARASSIVLVALLGLGVLVSDEPPNRASVVADHYPPESAQLSDLSDVLVARLDPSSRTRILGTFNEFGTGWIQVLRDRHARSFPVTVDAPYPLEQDREGRSPSWSEAYRSLVDEWACDRLDRMLVIEVADGSPFDSRDYDLWNRWKKNFVRAAVESDRYEKVESVELRGGVVLHVFDVTGDPSRVQE